MILVTSVMSGCVPTLPLWTGCAAPCSLTPQFSHDEGHEVTALVVEQTTMRFLEWTGPQCLASVEVTEQAPLEGERRRARGKGWTLQLHPETAGAYLVQWHLCELLQREEDLLSEAPPELFSSETLSRESMFLEVCAAGPYALPFAEQARACELPPLTPEQAFVQQVVYEHYEAPTAPDFSLDPGEPVSIGLSEGQLLAHTLSTQGRHVLARALEGGPPWLELHSLAGITRELELPDLSDETHFYAMAASSDEVAVVARQEETHELLLLDRSAGITTRLALGEVPQELPYGSGRALVGDELVVASPRQLHALSTRDGQLRSLPLPAPDLSQLHAAPGGLWLDPERPGSLLVSYSVQHLEQLEPDFILILVLEQHLARVDLDSGAWETLRSQTTSNPGPAFYPLGVTRDGQWILRIVLDSHATLLGALDTETSELRVSGSLCLGQDDPPWDWLVVDDTLYEVDLTSETEVWTPYRPGL